MTVVAHTFDGQPITDQEWHTAWPNFTPGEIRSNGNGEVIVDLALMDKIQALRTSCGFGFVVSSGYRDPEYNASVSSTGLTGPHTRGAIDIKVSGQRAHTMLTKALAIGFSGIGIKQNGSHSGRFIHLDNLDDSELGPRPTLWSY